MFSSFGKLICMWKGHRRNVLVRTEGDVDGIYKTYRCPRCGKEKRVMHRKKVTK